MHINYRVLQKSSIIVLGTMYPHWMPLELPFGTWYDFFIAVVSLTPPPQLLSPCINSKATRTCRRMKKMKTKKYELRGMSERSSKRNCLYKDNNRNPKSLKYNRCMYRNKNAEYLQQEQQWRRRKRRRRTYNNTKWARERSATHSIFDSFVFAATVESFFCLCFSQHLLLLLLFCRCVVLLLPQRFLAALYVTAIKFNCNYVSHVVSAFGQERFSLVKSQCDTFHLKDICMYVCVYVRAQHATTEHTQNN